MTNLEKINEYAESIAIAKKSFTIHAKEFIMGAFKEEVFDKFSIVEAIRMRGYAPYFNDGDPCEFSLHEPDVLLKGIDSFVSSWGDWDDYDDLEEDEDGNTLNRPTSEELKEIFEAAGSVWEVIDEDVFRAVFGSDQEVTFYPDKVENDEYGQHD